MKLSQEEFEKEITEIDSVLAGRNMQIPGRPIQAIISLFQKFKVSGPIAHPFKVDMSFPVGAESLSNHVNSWYEKHYGNKIKVDPSPGRFPLVIEGATYECRIPLVLGTALVLASKERFTDKRTLNVIDHITDLPRIVRARLRGDMENYIQAIFLTCIEVSKELASRKTALCESAQTDSRIATDLLCGFNVNSSMSSWHSLQLAEKALKQYISAYEKPPFTHEIHKLVGVAERHGYKKDPRIRLDFFGFGASTRYEPHQISIDQAVLINHEAWRISFNVLKQA